VRNGTRISNIQIWVQHNSPLIRHELVTASITIRSSPSIVITHYAMPGIEACGPTRHSGSRRFCSFSMSIFLSTFPGPRDSLLRQFHLNSALNHSPVESCCALPAESHILQLPPALMSPSGLEHQRHAQTHRHHDSENSATQAVRKTSRGLGRSSRRCRTDRRRICRLVRRNRHVSHISEDAIHSIAIIRIHLRRASLDRPVLISVAAAALQETSDTLRG